MDGDEDENGDGDGNRDETRRGMRRGQGRWQEGGSDRSVRRGYLRWTWRPCTPPAPEAELAARDTGRDIPLLLLPLLLLLYPPLLLLLHLYLLLLLHLLLLLLLHLHLLQPVTPLLLLLLALPSNQANPSQPPSSFTSLLSTPLSAATHYLTPPFASKNHSAESHKISGLKIVIFPLSWVVTGGFTSIRVPRTVDRLPGKVRSGKGKGYCERWGDLIKNSYKHC